MHVNASSKRNLQLLLQPSWNGLENMASTKAMRLFVKILGVVDNYMMQEDTYDNEPLDNATEEKGVPWSNERPLENKELNAIIGAWFTLWRD
nr:ulp1 protease family, C-terminal catalytic domain-containing protein [Tanacetum cinerariifolium]